MSPALKDGLDANTSLFRRILAATGLIGLPDAANSKPQGVRSLVVTPSAAAAGSDDANTPLLKASSNSVSYLSTNQTTPASTAVSTAGGMLTATPTSSSSVDPLVSLIARGGREVAVNGAWLEQLHSYSIRGSSSSNISANGAVAGDSSSRQAAARVMEVVRHNR